MFDLRVMNGGVAGLVDAAADAVGGRRGRHVRAAAGGLPRAARGVGARARGAAAAAARHVPGQQGDRDHLVASLSGQYN